MLSRSDKLKRKKINKFLSFIVICVTLSILILPAFTLEKKDDDTNENNGPTTVENINERGGVEESNDPALVPVINNNNEESSSEDDVLVVSEDEPLLLAEGETTAVTSPFVLSNDSSKINSVKLTCSVDGVEKEFPLADGERPDNTSFKIRVEFKDVRKADLRDLFGGSFVYNLPDMGFKISETTEREITDEHNEQIGTISFENEGKTIRITYTAEYLKGATSTDALKGDFNAEAKVDLGQLDKTNGTINFAKPDSSTIELNYGPDYIERYGNVNVSKDFERDITSDYIKYKVTVTAGKYGSKNVYVVDKFSGNKGIVEKYVDIPTNSPGTLASGENGNSPYETINSSNSSAVAGELYLANEPSGSDKVPKPIGDGTLSQPGCIVWTIGNMAPNESRVLTYYVKLKDTSNTFDTRNNQTLKNTANLYTKKTSIVGTDEYYDKGLAEKTFTPRLNKNMSKTGTYDIENGVINYTLEFGVLDGTNYLLKNVVFHDFLKHQDVHLNDDIDAFLNNFRYLEDSIKVEKKTKSDPNYQVLTRGEDYTVSFINSPNKKFEIKGTDDRPFDMTVGDCYKITYNVEVNPNIFAEKMANELDVINRFSVSSNNAAWDSNGTMINAINNTQKIGGYKWVEKTIGEALTADKNINILSSEKVYFPDGRDYDNSKDNAFIAYKGSYKYTVVLNKTRGQWDITGADLSDNFSSANMKYLGFMKITAHDAKTDEQIGDAKWVHIDNLTSFNIQLKKFDWAGNKYSYKLEYYAQPVGLDNVVQVTVGNSFKISKAVNSIGTEFNFKDSVKANQSVTLAGYYNLNFTKTAWYYEDPKRENIGKAWENGELYWIIKASGNKIRKNYQIKEVINTTENNASYIRNDSVVGIYRGNYDISSYKNFSEFIKANNPVNEKSLFEELPRNNITASYPTGTYNDLFLTAKEDITLGDNNNLYIVLKTEPKTLPQYRKSKSYLNSLYTIEPDADGNKQGEGAQKQMVSSFSHTISGGRIILKELGQVFKYDGTYQVIDRGADNTLAEQRIPVNLLNNADGTPNSGLYVSWAFKVNHAGNLSGDYQVLEQIPDGMELAYIRIKWHGNNIWNNNPVTTGEINGLDGTWTLKTNTANDDRGISRTTQYYVKDGGREALIKLCNFTAGKEEDKYAVDVQVVCKVTDKFYLMNGESKTFNNRVTLYDSNGNEMATANNSKQLDKSNFSTLIKDGTRVGDTKKIEYTIVANPMGQMLPTNTSDNSKLTLIDIMSKDLILLPKTITVKDTDNNDVGSYTISNESTGTKLIVTIPNGKKVTIKYTATVKINSGQTKNINNKVYWEDYSESGLANKNFDNFSYTASAGGSTSTTTKPVLTIEKYDSDNPTKNMNGVGFDVYKCILQDDNTIVHDDTVAKSSGATTADGTLKIDLLEYNTIYEVQEPIAPEGYEDNNQKYYIMYKKIDNDTTADVKAYVDKCVTYSNTGNNLIIAESPEEFKLEVYNKQKGIKVTKQFLNAGGNPIKPIAGTYGFGLYATPNPSAGDLAIQKVWITYNTGDDVKTDGFINLNDINGTYYVFELDQNGQPITDSNVHVVAGMECLTTYKITKADGTESSGINPIKVGDTVTVTNQVYTRQLPATGGNGINGYIKSGAILMLLTGVMLFRRK